MKLRIINISNLHVRKLKHKEFRIFLHTNNISASRGWLKQSLYPEILLESFHSYFTKLLAKKKIQAFHQREHTHNTHTNTHSRACTHQKEKWKMFNIILAKKKKIKLQWGIILNIFKCSNTLNYSYIHTLLLGMP